MAAIFIPISLFLAIFASLYVYWSTRNKERLALVEKGLGVEIFTDKTSKKPTTKHLLLKLGIFLVSLAVGVFSGFLLSTVMDEVVAFFTMILLFGGIGLIVAYYLTSTLESKENELNNTKVD